MVLDFSLILQCRFVQVYSIVSRQNVCRPFNMPMQFIGCKSNFVLLGTWLDGTCYILAGIVSKSLSSFHYYFTEALFAVYSLYAALTYHPAMHAWQNYSCPKQQIPWLLKKKTLAIPRIMMNQSIPYKDHHCRPNEYHFVFILSVLR